MKAQDVIRELALQPLPGEGGYFRETYRSHDTLVDAGLPARFAGRGSRSAMTAIYYLVTRDSFSTVHRLQSDEVYHFYGGQPAELLMLTADGQLERVLLGSDWRTGQHSQWAVRSGIWQAVHLADPQASAEDWSLLGTSVGPGFDFADFESAGAEILAEFPQHAELLKPLLFRSDPHA